MKRHLIWRQALLASVATAGLLTITASVAQAASVPSGHSSTVLMADPPGSPSPGDGIGKGKGKPPKDVPETPYAAVFPVVIAGATWLVYRRRQRQRA
ncbi:MAG: hypothetical protein M1272_00170 [Firmicutes bacterium]|nr:hypothetical protein [Bacillota bacterium]